jgi:cell wall-associated NlpC family hydrolase
LQDQFACPAPDYVEGNVLRSYAKYSICLLIVSLLLTLSPLEIDAASYAQLKAAKQSEKQTQGQIATNSSRINSTEAQLVSLKTSLDELDRSMSKNQTGIASERVTLQGLQTRESAEEAARQVLVQGFNEVLVSTYENGGSAEYLSILLQAANWQDFLWRLDAVTAILKHNQTLQQNIISQSQIIKGQEASIDQDMAGLQAAIDQENQLASLKKQTDSNEQLVLSGLSSKQRQLAEQKLSQQNTVNNIQQELLDQEEEARIAAANGPIKSEGGITSITRPVAVGAAGISSLISFAEGFIGTPYVWGGTTPRPGFDCSGFTQYAFSHLGISLKRTSEEQCLEGTPVSENALEPGDLVFFSTYASGASHVGIYIGNDLMVDSEVSGVIIDNVTNAYWAPRYLRATRIAH